MPPIATADPSFPAEPPHKVVKNEPINTTIDIKNGISFAAD